MGLRTRSDRHSRDDERVKFETAERDVADRGVEIDLHPVKDPARGTSAEDAKRGGRRRSLDPQGRRALFETPVSAARDVIRSGTPREGKEALYSSGPRQRGTVVVHCSSCQARSFARSSGVS